MYLLERGFQWSRDLMSYGEATEELRKQERQPGQSEIRAREGVGESVSDGVLDNGSIYNANQIYIDVRTPNDEKRGGNNYFLAFSDFFFAACWAPYTHPQKNYFGENHYGRALGWSDYFPMFLFSVLWLIFLMAFIRYSI